MRKYIHTYTLSYIVDNYLFVNCLTNPSSHIFCHHRRPFGGLIAGHIGDMVNLENALSFKKLFQENANFGNLQCIMLAGEPNAGKAIESVGQNISLMGSTCMYNKFVTDCSLLLGWNLNGLKLDERTNNSAICLELDDSLISDYNREDQKLFEWHINNREN